MGWYSKHFWLGVCHWDSETLFQNKTKFSCIFLQPYRLITLPPCWWLKERDIAHIVCKKMEVNSQRRNILLFHSTNMATMMAHANSLDQNPCPIPGRLNFFSRNLVTITVQPKQKLTLVTEPHKGHTHTRFLLLRIFKPSITGKPSLD